MQTTLVDLKERSYNIYIGEKILDDHCLLQQPILGKQVCIVTNETVAPLYLEKIKHAYSDYQCDEIILPDGEEYKTLEYFNQIITCLLEKGHRRHTTLIALGGGVIGDMTGFAAACYQRGVAFIQIPTTLLAQTDASVGGKTAVNHALGKNMIGAFHQPKAVLIDVNTLDTLPDREYCAGLAEVIKHGLIADQDFFTYLENNINALLQREKSALIDTIKTACKIKTQIVIHDEREQGKRALLNLGHTFAHALECATHYKQWLHGEAVAIGLCLAADLSARLGYIKDDDVSRIRRLLQKAQLPCDYPSNISEQELIAHMQRDKKVLEKHMRFVLLTSIGDAIIDDKVSHHILQETLRGGKA